MFVGSTPRVFVAFFCTPGFHAQDTCQFGDLEPFWATPPAWVGFPTATFSTVFLGFLHSRDLTLETSVAFTPKTPVNSEI